MGRLGVCLAAGAICLSLGSEVRAQEEGSRYERVTPRVMPYDDEKPIPFGYHVESHPRQGMIIGGIITFTVSYMFALPAASTEGSGRLLLIPFAGPFMFERHVQDTCPNPECDMGGAIDLYFMASGVGQIFGAGLVLIGYASQERTLVRGVGQPTSVTLALTPATAGTRGIGLGAVGTF